MPDRQEVLRFLLELRQAVKARGLDLVPREGTLETLRVLGWTKRNLEEAVLDLSTLDYSKGPEADRDRPGEVWVFGVSADPHEIYIKLKLFEAGGIRMAKCISFHIALRPMHHPFKEEGR